LSSSRIIDPENHSGGAYARRWFQYQNLTAQSFGLNCDFRSKSISESVQIGRKPRDTGPHNHAPGQYCFSWTRIWESKLESFIELRCNWRLSYILPWSWDPDGIGRSPYWKMVAELATVIVYWWFNSGERYLKSFRAILHYSNHFSFENTYRPTIKWKGSIHLSRTGFSHWQHTSSPSLSFRSFDILCSYSYYFRYLIILINCSLNPGRRGN
jgi:hypothetical protein